MAILFKGDSLKDPSIVKFALKVRASVIILNFFIKYLINFGLYFFITIEIVSACNLAVKLQHVFSKSEYKKKR